MLISGSCITLGFTLFVSIYSWLPGKLKLSFILTLHVILQDSLHPLFSIRKIWNSPLDSPPFFQNLTRRLSLTKQFLWNWNPPKNILRREKPFFLNLCDLKSPGRREKLREVPKKTVDRREKGSQRAVENRVILKIFKHISLPGNASRTGIYTRTCGLGLTGAYLVAAYFWDPWLEWHSSK